MTRRERERKREFWTGKRSADLDADQLAQARAAGYVPDLIMDRALAAAGQLSRTLTFQIMRRFPRVSA